MEIIEAKNSIENEVREYVDALQIKVTDSPSCVIASESLKEIKRRMKVIDDRLEPEKKKAYVAYTAWNDLIKELKKPYLEKEVYLKQELSRYDQEQEKIRKQEEDRLREEARKQEEESQIAAAIAAEQEGDKEEAEAIIAAPVYTPPIVLPKITPKVSGISYRENWTFEVVNLMDLVKAVAAGIVPIQALHPNMTFLGSQARNLKSSMRYPGVNAYAEKIVSAGRR